MPANYQPTSQIKITIIIIFAERGQSDFFQENDEMEAKSQCTGGKRVKFTLEGCRLVSL